MIRAARSLALLTTYPVRRQDGVRGTARVAADHRKSGRRGLQVDQAEAFHVQPPGWSGTASRTGRRRRSTPAVRPMTRARRRSHRRRCHAAGPVVGAGFVRTVPRQTASWRPVPDAAPVATPVSVSVPLRGTMRETHATTGTSAARPSRSLIRAPPAPGLNVVRFHTRCQPDHVGRPPSDMRADEPTLAYSPR